jgi:exonuclease III
MLQPEVYKSIVSVKRVNPTNRTPRLDLVISGSAAAGLKRTIKDKTSERTPYFCRLMRQLYGKAYKAKALSKWRIDLYKDWRDREVNPHPVQALHVPISWKDSFATMNLNGWKSKQEALVDYLIETGITVCAIQETLVSERAYPIKVEGYRVYTQPWTKEFRGQALLVHNHLMSYQVSSSKGKYIHVKVNGIEGANTPVHVIAVYMPSGGNYRESRSTALKELLALNKKILDGDPRAPILMLGDWNLSVEDLRKRLKTELTGLKVLPTRGSPLSRFPVNGKPQAIDHMVGNDRYIALVRKPRVERNMGLSDHRPLVTTVRAKPKVERAPTVKWSYNTQTIKRYAREIVSSNKWNLLEVEEYESNERLDKMAESFSNTVDEQLRHYAAKRQSGGGALKLPRKLKELVKRRNKLADKLAAEVTKKGDPSTRIVKQFMKAQKAYREAHKKWRHKQDHKIIGYTSSDIVRCDYKSVWNRVTRKIKHDGMSGSAQPVKDKNGKLCVTNDEILDAIAEHYDSLANADPGESQNEEHWASIDMGEPEPELEGVNAQLTWPEVLMSIRRMNRNTTPGVDEVHVNLLKELLAEECMAEVLLRRPGMQRPENVVFALGETELPKVPRTEMGKAMFSLLKEAWDTGCIPDQWNTVLITNLYKSGDPENMSNYRGISLISVTLKTLLGVMADRIGNGCERRNLIVPEQAGFRKHEEAVAQFIAVAEIIRRRCNKGMPTYGVFVDFKKAYDKVHHEALYRIIDHMGIRGKALNLIKYMYRNSQMVVKQGTLRSRAFGMKRGNRQGCPLSPLLFILFVNHLLKEIPTDGVEVPGVPRHINGGRCKGGQYADDLVGLAETSEDAGKMANGVYDWGVKWGMELGIPKCGVLLWTPSIEDEQNPQVVERVNEEKRKHAEASYVTPVGVVPKVLDYKYLGITVTESFGTNGKVDEQGFSKLQASKGEKTLNALRPLLVDKTWPIPIKAMVIQTILMPIMLYGSEWTGYSQRAAAPLQRVMNKAMRYAMGNSSKSNAHESFTLAYELGIPTVEMKQASLRARLSAKMTKTSKLKTWLGVLGANPHRARKKSWVTTNKWWETMTIKKYKKSGEPLRTWAAKGHIYEAHTRCNTYRCESVDRLRDATTVWDKFGFHNKFVRRDMYQMANEGDKGRDIDLPAERDIKIVTTKDQNKTLEEWEYVEDIKDCVLERAFQRNNSETFKYYNKWAFGATRGYLRSTSSRPDLVEGVAWLIRIRTRAYPRVNDVWQRTVRGGKTPTFEKDRCPLCKDRIVHGYEWVHLLIECDDLDVERRRTIWPAKELIESEILRNLKPGKGLQAYKDWRSFRQAVGVSLVGGVIEGDFDNGWIRGFGHLDELPKGLEEQGYVYAAEFFKEVTTKYLKVLYPTGGYLWKDGDGLESVYSPTDTSRSVSAPPGLLSPLSEGVGSVLNTPT